MHTKLYSETLQEKARVEDTSYKIGCEGVVWIHLANERDQWWGFANTVIKFPSYKEEELPFQLSDYQRLKQDSGPRN
jgi:hypothetical protein